MNIAELFVNLGIKGSEKTIGSLTNVGGKIKELGSSSWEAKAAIVGAMYALERLFSKSGQAGTDLTNFNSILGTSTKTLQQYQYAARQVGVSNQETESTFKSLQSSMTKLRMGEGAPKGYAQVAFLTGGISTTDVDRFMQNPELLLQRLQQYAQKEKRLGLRNEVLKSFGLSDNMVAAVSRNAFTPNALQKAPTYNEREIAALDRANIAWSNLGNKVAMAFGKFNAAHGGQLVRDISLITDKVLILVQALVKLADSLKFFEGIGKMVEGLTMLFDITSDAAKTLQTPQGRQTMLQDTIEIGKFAASLASSAIASLMAPSTDKDKSEFQSAKDFFKDTGKFAASSASSAAANLMAPSTDKDKPGFQSAKDFFKGWGSEIFGKIQPAAAPSLLVVPPDTSVSPVSPMPAVQPTSKTTSQNINVNQSFNYTGDGKDQRQTADTMKRAVQEAFRQMSSQVQGS